MKAVCEGRKSRREVIDETIEQYRAVYAHTQQRLDMLQAVSGSSFTRMLYRCCRLLIVLLAGCTQICFG